MEINNGSIIVRSTSLTSLSWSLSLSNVSLICKQRVISVLMFLSFAILRFTPIYSITLANLLNLTVDTCVRNLETSSFHYFTIFVMIKRHGLLDRFITLVEIHPVNPTCIRNKSENKSQRCTNMETDETIMKYFFLSVLWEECKYNSNAPNFYNKSITDPMIVNRSQPGPKNN